MAKSNASLFKALGFSNIGNSVAAENELKSLIIKVISTRAGLEPVMEIIGGIAISLVILLAGWQIVSGASTVG